MKSLIGLLPFLLFENQNFQVDPIEVGKHSEQKKQRIDQLRGGTKVLNCFCRLTIQRRISDLQLFNLKYFLAKLYRFGHQQYIRVICRNTQFQGDVYHKKISCVLENVHNVIYINDQRWQRNSVHLSKISK